MKLHETIVHRLFVVLGLALIAPAARAQFTNNFQTNTISAVTSNWVGNGTYVVGSNTFLDTLIIQSGGVLSNGTGYIGYESSGSNNTAIVRDSGSMWTNQFDLFVGYMGAGNQLVISNGGQVFSTNAAIGSTFASASNNTAIVTGSNSLWSVAGLLNIGSNAANNTLVITNGGQVVDETAFVSTDAGGGYNVSALVTGTNSVWRNGPVLISVASPGNAITVADGAQFFSGGTVQIGRSAGASGNIVLVTDPGTTWSNSLILQVSAFGSFTEFIVSNGATAYTGLTAVIGGNANTVSNGVVVTGPGSAWTVNNQIIIAGSGADSFLIVSNGGLVQAHNEFVANQVGSSGFLIVAGGTNEVFNSLQLGQSGGTGTVNIASGALFVTNATATASAVVNANCTLILGAGTFKADNLVVTNGGAVQYNLTYLVDNGTVTVAGGSLQAGSNLVIATTANSTGTVVVVGGSLVATNGAISVGNDGSITSGGGVGLLIVSNGTLQASTILLGSSAGGQGDLILADGGVVQCFGTNAVLLCNDFGQVGGDLSWTNIGSAMYCGYAHPGAYALSNGNSSCQDMYVGYDNAGTMTIDGGAMNILSRLIVGQLGSPLSTGTVWMTGGQLSVPNSYTIIGNSGVGQMTMSNGTMTAATVIVGNGSNPGALTVAGGTLTMLSGLTVGDCGGGMMGIVTITGGNMFVTNAAHNATLDVRAGTLTVSSGTLVVDKIILTNICAHLAFTGGAIIAGTAVLDPNQSAVGDGIPNGWKQHYGLDPFDFNLAGEDPDGDGFTNWQEFLAGTDPTNPQSTPLRITAIAREGNNIRITWSTLAGTTNIVQATSGTANGSYSANNFADIAASWTIVVGSGETSTSYVDPSGATNAPARYYRIRLVP